MTQPISPLVAEIITHNMDSLNKTTNWLLDHLTLQLAAREAELYAIRMGVGDLFEGPYQPSAVAICDAVFTPSQHLIEEYHRNQKAESWSTKYRLPDGSVREGYGGRVGGLVGFDLPDLGRVWISCNDLTEVVPPLPPEPAELGWYLATIGGTEVPFRKPADDEWWAVYRDYPTSWAQLNEDHPGIKLRRLVSAPEPVELPWLGATVEIRVVPGATVTPIRIGTSDDPEYINPTIARCMASALLTAADQVEATDAPR